MIVHCDINDYYVYLESLANVVERAMQQSWIQ